MSAIKKKVEEQYGPLEGIEGEPEIQGKISMEDLVRRQIDRTLVSRTTDPLLFEANVELLQSMLPSDKLEDLKDHENEYKTLDVDIRDVWCGEPVGQLRTEKGIDYRILFELVLKALEESGLTWKVKNETVERGRVEKSPEPTPYHDDKRAEQEQKRMDDMKNE